MNLQTINRSSSAALGLIAASVIFAVLAVAVKLSHSVPAINADRAAERTKALAEIHKVENIGLHFAGWVDERRGVVRLPIETGIKLAAREWQNPASARADLIARAEKAAAPLPKAPEQPSAFE
jgi:hypothetical protein